MATNKVIYGNTTLIDTTSDTADVADVKAGETFHSRSGAQLTGTMVTSPKNVWYATCSTGADITPKVINTNTADFNLQAGAIVFVKFTYGNSLSVCQFNVDSTGAKYYKNTTTEQFSKLWKDGEIVSFVYDGDYYIMLEGGQASTSYYGVTMLSSSTSSTATNVAATPSAVKQAYDLANDNASKIDALTTVESYRPTWASTTGCADCVVYRCGKIGQIHILNINKLATGSNVPFTLPDGWRPVVDTAQTVPVPAATITNGSTQLSLRMIVKSNGQVEIYNYRSSAITSSTNASIGFAYIIDRTI